MSRLKNVENIIPPWIYQGKPFEDYSGFEGFVYILTDTTNNRKYIGRKYFESITKIPPLKGKKRKRTKIKESDWQSYYSSSSFIKEQIDKNGRKSITREILTLFKTRGQTNVAEIRIQFAMNVLDSFDEESGMRCYYNKNIAGRYYPNKHINNTEQDLIRIKNENSRIRSLITSNVKS